MKLVSYGPAGDERAGIIVADRVVDLAELLGQVGVSLRPPTLSAYLARSDWSALLDIVKGRPMPAGMPRESVRLGPPIDRPGNIFVVGANTHSHVREAGRYTRGLPPVHPMILAKATSAVTGPFDPIVYPPATRKLDYEVELGVVIGRPTKDIDAAEANSAIAGYLVVNDVSARDIQLGEGESNTFYRTHYLGKSFDTFCPTGPWMVTSDELSESSSVSLRTWVNQDLRQDGTTSDLCFSIPQLVAYLSSVATLHAGDLICTGSPAGVAAFRADAAFLQPGDVVRCEVGGIGFIRNRVVQLGD